MYIYRLTHFGFVTALLALILAGCSPLQPVMRESAMAPSLPVMNELVSDVTVAGEPLLFTTPLDATPDSSGDWIYFTALDDAGNGLFRVPAAGGEVTAILVGAPMALPQGLAISSDDSTLYVADAGANQLWAVALADGSAQEVVGTAGTMPRGVEVVATSDGDMIYFSGIDPVDSQPALLTIAAQGGDLAIVAKGAPLIDPVGVAVAADGTIYVVDRGVEGNALGNILRIRAGLIEMMSAGIHVGQFPGLALTLDESALLVSTLANGDRSAQVLVTVLASGDQVIVNQVIAANKGAGGLHRARNVNIFAWADSPDQGSGRVYRVRTP